MSANDIQVGGDHYRKRPIQTWDFIVTNNMNFLQGSIIKYVVRYQDKGGLQDLQKARHYLDKLIETISPEVPPVEVQPIPNAPYGLKKDGTPRARPGRRPGQKNRRVKK